MEAKEGLASNIKKTKLKKNKVVYRRNTDYADRNVKHCRRWKSMGNVICYYDHH